MNGIFHIPNLYELVREASDAALFCQAIAASLRYPPVDGQREVLARMADIAAERTAKIHSELSASMEAKGQRERGAAAPYSPSDEQT